MTRVVPDHQVEGPGHPVEQLGRLQADQAAVLAQLDQVAVHLLGDAQDHLGGLDARATTSPTDTVSSTSRMDRLPRATSNRLRNRCMVASAWSVRSCSQPVGWTVCFRSLR